jgi:uncharacterized protein (DUF433 family)
MVSPNHSAAIRTRRSRSTLRFRGSRSAFALPLGHLQVPLDSKARESTLHSMDYRERITIDPRIRSGKPCIRGTRIAVADIFDYLGGGMSIAEVLDDFPDLTAEDIQACFAFAADRDRRLNVVPNEAAVR